MNTSKVSLSACLAGLLWAVPVSSAEIQLLPEPFGSQVAAYYFWEDADGTRSSFAIYDTGASVCTRAYLDQLLDEFLQDLGLGPGPIPAEVPGGAVADALGSTIVGDISTGGAFAVVGLDDVTLDLVTFELNFDFSQATIIPDTRLFLGTESGSPVLPSIIGMPAHKVTSARPAGTESLVDMQGFVIDFVALFPDVFPPDSYPDGLIVTLPDTRFAATGTLAATGDPVTLFGPFRIPLGTIGESTSGPGVLTNEPSPVIENVTFTNAGASSGGLTALLDYGAQLTAMDEALLGTIVDLSSPPDFEIDVQGAGSTFPVKGWFVTDCSVPLDTNFDGTADDELTFLGPVVFGIPGLSNLGIDVIFGMNFFNTASEMLFSPHDPLGASLTVTYFQEFQLPELGEDEELGLALLEFFAGIPLNAITPGSKTPYFDLAAAGDIFVKNIVAGPDRDENGQIDRVVGVLSRQPSEFTFKITFQQSGLPPACIEDIVPFQWEVVRCVPDDPTDLVLKFPVGPSHARGYRDTQIQWFPADNDGCLTCTLRTRPSGRRQSLPSDCGCLPINRGARAVDTSSSRQPLFDDNGDPLVTNALMVAAVKDSNRDRRIDYTGNGDEDGDGLTDYQEACVIGTNPCDSDTDNDRVPDGQDPAPLDRRLPGR